MKWVRYDLKWKCFWRLIVVWFSHMSESRCRSSYWNCICKCWKEICVRWTDLTGGQKSCWCLFIEQSTKHWMSRTPIFNIFRHIKQRCNNKRNHAYKYYWWRWIKCEWEAFEKFYEDMWSTYKDWLTIERKNVDWNYEKWNCEWIPLSEQSQNKTNTRYIEYDWIKKSVVDWWKITWIKSKTIKKRLKLWRSIEKSLTIK